MVVNQDFIIAGQTSEYDAFFLMASPAVSGIHSIDDLANPTKTVGLSPGIMNQSPMNTGLAKGTKRIVDEVNKRRRKADPNAFNFTLANYFSNSTEFMEILNNNNVASSTAKFIANTYAPKAQYNKYIVAGSFHQLKDGEIGSSLATGFGVPNRGVTIATTQFAKSGILDTLTWHALSSLFIGTAEVSKLDEEITPGNSSAIALGERARDAFLSYTKKPENVYWYENIKSLPAFPTFATQTITCRI